MVILPIRVSLDPMERLLVADFKRDPEFTAIEPQVFDDPVNGKGMRILRYRKDGMVDVYWQPGVRVDRESFVVGAGIREFAETAIEPARLEIGERGVHCHVVFTDAQARRMEFRVVENAAGKRGFPLLAPVGADIRNPRRLFLVYMPAIDLVRRRGTVVEGRLGDRELRPASLPLLIDGHRVLFIRYAAHPVIGVLNSGMNRPVVLDVPMPGSATIDGMTITVDADGDVSSLAAGSQAGRVLMEMAPAFPNLARLENGGSASGRWSIRIVDVPITGGTYSVSRNGDRAAVELDVSESWKPARLPLAMKVFVRLVPKFRTWPSTYRWRGSVNLGAEPTMTGAWERK